MRRGLIVLCLWLTCLHAGAETLVLAYPERQRLPFMAEAPSNEGIYRDVFSRAAALIVHALELQVELDAPGGAVVHVHGARFVH